MSTRAQIGFYSDESNIQKGLGNALPVAILYQHSDGYPTSKEGGVVRSLIDICVPLIDQRGSYDAEYLAAQTLYQLIDRFDRGVSGLGFGIYDRLQGDTRFYYAVTPEGVHVFDARTLDGLEDVDVLNEMFFKSWAQDDRRRKVESEIEDLEARLKDLYNERKSVAMAKP